MNKLECFKAYDIRGKVPQQLDVDLSYKIGVAYANIISPDSVIVGYDVRLESPLIANAVIKGLTDSGVNVVNIGLCGTEEVYFHSFDKQKQGIDGGIMITASHNPKGYNGMKMVKLGARPMSGADDLQKIHDYILSNKTPKLPINKGKEITQNDKSSYIAHLLQYIDINKIKPLKIVVNSGNGTASTIIKLLEQKLPCEFIHIHDTLDGNFPNGVANPMIEKNRIDTINAVKENKADLGVAWDNDFDRCFLFDEKGSFIEGYYIVGLLAENLLGKNPNEAIIHDPRLIWNTIDIVNNNSGRAVESESGHSFIKETMRKENAIYGGEMSAHHYFRDFAYCDSGMIPWLLIIELLSNSDNSLSELVEKYCSAYPCSGEINYKVTDTKIVIKEIENYFKVQKPKVSYVDGLSMEFANWRFNLRESNTEPLIRLNIETKNDKELIKNYIIKIESIIKPYIIK